MKVHGLQCRNTCVVVCTCGCILCKWDVLLMLGMTNMLCVEHICWHKLIRTGTFVLSWVLGDFAPVAGGLFTADVAHVF